MLGGQDECAIFKGRVPEADESVQGWLDCKKYPGHEEFIPVPYFKDNYLPSIPKEACRMNLERLIDRTVRVRVTYISPYRPEGGDFSDRRGKRGLHAGTGCIQSVSDPVENKRCRCLSCRGEERRLWEIEILTARHVVYNTEEAEKTEVNLFYDYTGSDTDGTMKTLYGLKVSEINPDRDVCILTCVTCDEKLAGRIKSACSGINEAMDENNFRYNLKSLPMFQKVIWPVLIVSHPHGQPKQITVGKLRYRDKSGFRHYTTPTCNGCSGAPVVMEPKDNRFYWFQTTHKGGYYDTSIERHDRPSTLETPTPTQEFNYGYDSIFGDEGSADSNKFPKLVNKFEVGGEIRL